MERPTCPAIAPLNTGECSLRSSAFSLLPITYDVYYIMCRLHVREDFVFQGLISSHHLFPIQSHPPSTRILSPEQISKYFTHVDLVHATSSM